MLTVFVVANDSSSIPCIRALALESREDLVIARVNYVRALTSDLEMANKTSVPSESKLIASALTHLSLRRFPVWLELGLLYPEK